MSPLQERLCLKLGGRWSRCQRGLFFCWSKSSQAKAWLHQAATGGGRTRNLPLLPWADWNSHHRSLCRSGCISMLFDFAYPCHCQWSTVPHSQSEFLLPEEFEGRRHGPGPHQGHQTAGDLHASTCNVKRENLVLFIWDAEKQFSNTKIGKAQRLQYCDSMRPLNRISPL